MLGILLGVSTGCLFVWTGWVRMMNGGENSRLLRINETRCAQDEVGNAVKHLILAIHETRKQWLETDVSVGISLRGPSTREVQLLDEALRHARGLRRQLIHSRRDFRQMSARELRSLLATLTLIREMIQGYQLCVDASRVRLEALLLAAQAVRSEQRGFVGQMRGRIHLANPVC